MFEDASRNAVQAANKGLVRLQQALDVRLDVLDRAGKGNRLTLLPIGAEAIPRNLYSDAIHLNAEGNRLACGLLSSWLATP